MSEWLTAWLHETAQTVLTLTKEIIKGTRKSPWKEGLTNYTDSRHSSSIYIQHFWYLQIESPLLCILVFYSGQGFKNFTLSNFFWPLAYLTDLSVSVFTVSIPLSVYICMQWLEEAWNRLFQWKKDLGICGMTGKKWEDKWRKNKTRRSEM